MFPILFNKIEGQLMYEMPKVDQFIWAEKRIGHLEWSKRHIV